MIHINGSSKSSPPLSSTMCSRRHKGMLQTSIILVLIVCIGYGFYLYNVLQVKIKYLDMKSLRHQSQQQSLSSQLQAAYEDRARLEKSMQKSKSELQKTQDEKEAMIQEMLIEHQDKNVALKKAYAEVQAKNKELNTDNKNLKSRHDRIYKDHDDLKKKHQGAMLEHADRINEVHVELQKYQHENQAILQMKQDLEREVQEVKENYAGLKSILKAVPADAVNFDHPDMAKLDPNTKNALKDHFGKSKDLGHWGQPQNPEAHEVDNAVQQRELEKNNKKQEYLEERPRQQQEFPNDDHISPAQRDNHEGFLQQQQQQGKLSPVVNEEGNMLDICSLRPDPGPCREPGKIRFAYNPGLKECRGFMYGGCGGNQNSFESIDLCIEVCKDPERRYIHTPLTEEQQVIELQKQGVFDRGDNPEGELDDAEDQPDPNIQKVVGKSIEEMDGAKRQNEDEMQGNGDEDEEQRRLTQEEELRAREQEEAAQRELEGQREQLDSDTDGEDPLEKLKQNSKMQLEVAQNQRADMEKLLDTQQRDHQMRPTDLVEARIEDEDGGGNEDEDDEEEQDENQDGGDNNLEEEDEAGENDEYDENEGRVGKEEDDVQVELPPAAQVAGQDPEAVMNAPPPNEDGIDSKEINGQDIYAGEEQQDDPRMNDQDDQAIEYQDGNQQEEGDAVVDANGGHKEEEEDEEGYDRDGGVREGAIGDEDKVNDPGDSDEYENEEEDEEEKEARKNREFLRMRSDKEFEVENGVQAMIPKDAKRDREI